MTITITNGSVSVEDGTKAGEEYAPARKVRVELSFDNPSGDDISTAGDLASAEVDRLLGRATAEKPKRQPRKAAEVKPAEAPPPSSDPLEGLGEVTAEPAPTETSAPAASAPASDDLDSLLGDSSPAPAEEITDQALTDAVTKTNKETKNPPAIRALVETYNPKPGDPFQLRQIPQDKRAEFIAKLGDVEAKK